MNAVVDGSVAAEQELTVIATALAQWYADRSSIRRLWAIEDPVALVVLVTLEPTSDGDDTLPVWLANHRDWATDLRLLTHREVQLKPIVSGASGESYVDSDAVTIAELGWRDSWVTP